MCGGDATSRRHAIRGIHTDGVVWSLGHVNGDSVLQEAQLFQALAAPCLEIVRAVAVPLGDRLWRVESGVANTGWLPTTVTDRAARSSMVQPVLVELAFGEGAEIVDGPNRRRLGQLAGRSGYRLDGGSRNDGTPDRALAVWTVRVSGDAFPDDVVVSAAHQRAGTRQRPVTVG